MCKRNSPHKNKASTEIVREIPQIYFKKKKKKKKKKGGGGCVRETSPRKMKQAWDI